MRAGKAYIASAGTTGVLIASAILLLVVVGSLMAFDRQAEPDALLPVPSVLVSPVERAKAQVATAVAEPDNRAGRSDRTRAGAADSLLGGPIADRRGSTRNDGGDTPSIPAVPDLANPPGEGSGDAQGPTATVGPAPAPQSEPNQASGPAAPVGGVVDDAVRDITTMLPRPVP